MWHHYYQYCMTYDKETVENARDFCDLAVALFVARRNLKKTCLWPKAERNETYTENLAIYKERVAKYKAMYLEAVNSHPEYVYAEILDAMIVFGNNTYNRDSTEEFKDFFSGVQNTDAKRLKALLKKYPKQVKEVASIYCTLANPGVFFSRAFFEAA